MISRTQLQLRVTYDAPVREARRALRVLPLSRPHQTVISETWRAAPAPDQQLEKRDAWGNRQLLLRHRALQRSFEFELELQTWAEAAPLPCQPDEPLGQWKMPSRAVDFGAELQDLARAARASKPSQRAAQFCEFCFDEMHYRSRAVTDPPLASEAWRRRVGSCADFAHVFLALCRASGLAARYVAGYNPAEGQLHAWAEVLIEKQWHAFDPTHGRAPSPGCVAIGVGRDFYDLAPHIGTFRGAAGAQLWLWCRTQTD